MNTAAGSQSYDLEVGERVGKKRMDRGWEGWRGREEER